MKEHIYNIVYVGYHTAPTIPVRVMGNCARCFHALEAENLTALMERLQEHYTAQHDT